MITKHEKKRRIVGASAFIDDIHHNKWLLAMSIPGFIMVFLFRYLPMGGMVMAFQNYSLYLGISGSKWVGFRNFVRFFSDPFFPRLLGNTFLLGLFDILWSFPAPILLALMLNEVTIKRFKKVTQTITYLPYFISVVIIVGIMRSIFGNENGVINDGIHALGGNVIAFFNETKWFRPLYIGSGIWQNVGYNSILYLAAITGIDSQLYEAAKIDGASKMACMFKITLPCMIPTIAVLFTLRIGSVLSVGFEKILLMYSPATYSVADVISTYVYRMGMLNQEFGYAAAVGLFNSVVAVMFLLLGNWTSRHLFGESLW
ncbi:MAG: ABC transporter permease subunit [Treponema sp.]|jgi:putative aldouronate transport system permease protein|nr:ABC transporter permease subunit [Treponema sp.]